MTDPQDRDRLPDAMREVNRFVASRFAGTELEAPEDADRLAAHRFANSEAHCWPTRTRRRIVMRMLAAMQRFRARSERIVQMPRGRRRYWALIWALFRQAASGAWLRFLLLVMPRCWCREKPDEEG